MLFLSKKDWIGYLVELFVVVLGILIAIQETSRSMASYEKPLSVCR